MSSLSPAALLCKKHHNAHLNALEGRIENIMVFEVFQHLIEMFEAAASFPTTVGHFEEALQRSN